ncbi:MAG TPA: serine hydrolase domain-containing protein [Nitriliruptorales bacterium]
MGQLTAAAGSIRSLVAETAGQLGVPGASVAVRLGDEVVEAATGVANVATGVEVTTDTLFQIGSITKTYTGTLTFQLVDEGLVELDAPVRAYLPDLQLADATAADEVTVRMLLSHTSGIEGDDFRDFGPGDDTIARWVDGLRDTGSIHPPGERFSYCNAGFVLLGRIIEVLRGAPWRVVLQERLLDPIGATRTFARPDEAILHRVAIGHLPDPEAAGVVPAPVFIGNYANAPAGSTLSATLRDVIRFADVHLDEGRAPDGAELLTPDAVKLMQTAQLELPPVTEFTHGALPWGVTEIGGLQVLAHPGGTLGQASLLMLVPERRFAVAAAGNGPGADGLGFAVALWLIQELFGVQPSAPGSSVRDDVDLARYEGVYERLNGRFDLCVGGDGLAARLPGNKLLPERFQSTYLPGGRPTARLVPLSEEVFAVQGNESDALGGRIVFSDFDDEGHPGCLSDVRLARRVPDATPEV